MNAKLANLVFANAMAVLFLGLVAGVALAFALLEGIGLWPLPIFDAEIPGSTRGWQAAHVGGILNGVMIVTLTWLTQKLERPEAQANRIGWFLIITGWGNTLFYWAGNLAANRGLSVTDTPYGAGDIWGALAYLGGGVAMFVTFYVVIVLGLAAIRRSKTITP